MQCEDGWRVSGECTMLLSALTMRLLRFFSLAVNSARLDLDLSCVGLGPAGMLGLPALPRPLPDSLDSAPRPRP